MSNNDPRVVKLLDKSQLVLNQGSNASIEVGQAYIIVRRSEEVVDPASGESLGVLEIPQGKGEVIHVQERMSLLAVELKPQVSKTPSEIMSSLDGIEETEELGIKVGDVAKLVS